MIYSTDSLKSEYKDIFNKKKNIDDISLYTECLTYISEEDEKLISSGMLFNEANLLGKTLNFITKKISVENIIQNIYDNFKKVINIIWPRFTDSMDKFYDDKEILFYKKEIYNLNYSIYFPESRYNYTNLGVTMSYTTFKNELNKVISEYSSELKKLKENKNTFTKLKTINNIVKDSKKDEEYFNDLRAKILAFKGTYSSNYGITEEEFPDRLYAYFRDNGVEIPPTKILPMDIISIYNHYISKDAIIKSLEKEKDSYFDAIKKSKSDIKKIKFEYDKEANILSNFDIAYLKLINAKNHKLNELCKIYAKFFSAKLDAVKENILQDQKILNHVIKVINGEITNEYY